MTSHFKHNSQVQSCRIQWLFKSSFCGYKSHFADLQLSSIAVEPSTEKVGSRFNLSGDHPQLGVDLFRLPLRTWHVFILIAVMRYKLS